MQGLVGTGRINTSTVDGRSILRFLGSAFLVGRPYLYCQIEQYDRENCY